MHQLETMPSLIIDKTKIIIKSTAPVSCLVAGFQVLMVLQFSCPCIFVLNQIIAFFILLVPGIFAWIILSLFLRFEEQENSGEPQVQVNSRRSKHDERLNRMIRWIPSVMWFCTFFIDGDYFACGLTWWNGYYACDTKLNPRCLNWCNPEPKQGTNMTVKYNITYYANISSKVNTKIFFLTQVPSFVREE